MRQMPELEVVKIPTTELVEYRNNAKLHDSQQVDQIAASIEKFNFADPIAAWHDDDGNAVIIEGHGRLMAAKKLGIEELPVIFLDYLTDEQRRAYTLVHNQTTLSSGFDLEILQAELEKITAIDMGEYGFDFTLEPLQDVQPEADDVPLFTDDVAEAGNMWQLGEHMLICGDSTDPSVIERLMQGEEADLLLTDPPYNVSIVGGTKDHLTIENDSFASDTAFGEFLTDAFNAATRHMRAGAAFYIWLASSELTNNKEAIEAAGLEVHQMLVWVKNHFVLGRQDYQNQFEPCIYGWKPGAGHWFAPTHKEVSVFDEVTDPAKMKKDELVALFEQLRENYESDVIRENRPMKSAQHPTMKPVKLFQRLIRNSSRKGEVVLDPFGGSGTTLIACEQMGRKARLVELDPHYCDVIIERWQNLTGETAVLVDG